MKLFNKISDALNKKGQTPASEEITFKDYSVDEANEVNDAPEAKSSTINAGEKSLKIKEVKPHDFEEVAGIADYLIDGCTVLFDAEDLTLDVLQRMLDFLNGVTYTTDGEIQHATTHTYLITPNNVDLSGV